MFFFPSLFVFLFNLRHPASDKLHDTATDDEWRLCAYVDADML